MTLPVTRSRPCFVELESLMRHDIFQDHRTLVAIYGHGSDHGHVNKISFKKFTFPLSKRAPHKVWP